MRNNNNKPNIKSAAASNAAKNKNDAPNKNNKKNNNTQRKRGGGGGERNRIIERPIVEFDLTEHLHEQERIKAREIEAERKYQPPIFWVKALHQYNINNK